MLKKLLAIAALIFAVVVLAWPPTYATDDSNIFLEEGDGDFMDPTDSPAATEPTAQQPPAPPIESADQAPAAAAPSPDAQVVTQPEEDLPSVSTLPEELPKKVKKAHKTVAAQKHPKAKKGGVGHFSIVKTECIMRREPASNSAELIKVRADRKIWVEDTNSGWVRGFRKSGDPGYLSKSCFE